MSDEPIPSGPTSFMTRDGERIEAEIHVPTAAAPAAMVIAHPHPTMGGSMHLPVPSALFDHAIERGVAVLRFNFRGVGRSTGRYDDGRGERLDLAAALAHLRSAVGPAVPLGATGWSFGADMALGLAEKTVEALDLGGWLAIAAPLRIVDPADMVAAAHPGPKLLAVPELDQYRSPASAAEITAPWSNTHLTVLPGCDHFLGGAGPALAAAQDRFVRLLTETAPTCETALTYEASRSEPT